MIKYLVIFAIVLDIYTLIDCAMTPQEKVRRFPKWAWLLELSKTKILVIGIIIKNNYLQGRLDFFQPSPVAGLPSKPSEILIKFL